MPAQWTGEIVSEMHLAGISKRAVAREMGVTAAYVGMILNGNRAPDGAEKRIREAVNRLKTGK